MTFYGMGVVTSLHQHTVYARSMNTTTVRGLFNYFKAPSAPVVVGIEEFQEYFKDKSYDSVFRDLDDNFDGKVDILELLIYFTLWSDTSWEYKKEHLFMVVDFNGKEYVRSDEIECLVFLILRVLKKTARLDDELDHHLNPANLQQNIAADVSSSAKGVITKVVFKEWWANNSQCQLLENFVNKHSLTPVPHSTERWFGNCMRMLQYGFEDHIMKAAYVRKKVSVIRNETVERSAPQRKSYIALTDIMDKAVHKIERLLEIEKNKIAELSKYIPEGSDNGLLDNSYKARTDQVLRSLELLQRSFNVELESASNILKKLEDITYSSPHISKSLTGVEEKLQGEHGWHRTLANLLPPESLKEAEVSANDTPPVTNAPTEIFISIEV